MTSNSARPLHIVQIGYDDSVFAEGAPSDSLRRQVVYGQELARQRPNSGMSMITLTNRTSARRFEVENISFIPVCVRMHNDLVKLLGELFRLQKERPIDVLATQTIHEDAWVALLFGRRHGVSVIGQVHYDIFSPWAQRDVLGPGATGRLRHILAMKFACHLYAIRVVSQRIKRGLLARRVNDNVHVLPVPVTMASDATSITAGNGPKRRVLFVGRLVRAKNLKDWLRVAMLIISRDNQVDFEIVGDGPLRSHLELEAGRMGIAERVHFRGFVPYDCLAPYYLSSVFLLTSHYEGFGRVLVESYLHGSPAVASRVAGTEDIVEEGTTGFLHSEGDVEGMAASVLRLLDNDSLRRQMGQAGCVLVRSRFDPQELSKQWVSLLVSGAEATGS